MLLQACFYGWGFYAIGDSDALELKLTGQPEVVVSSPAVEDADMPSSEPSHGMVQAEGSPRTDTTHETASAGVAAIDVHLEHTIVTPHSARASHSFADAIDTAQAGGEDEDDTQARQMEVGAMEGEPPRLQGVDGVLPLAAEAAQKSGFRAFKRFTTWHWKSARGKRTARVAPDVVEDDSPSDSDFKSIYNRVLVVLMSPNIISVMVGIVIAMSFQLQQQLFHNPQAVLRPLGASLEVRSCTAVARVAPPPSPDPRLS